MAPRGDQREKRRSFQPFRWLMSRSRETAKKPLAAPVVPSLPKSHTYAGIVNCPPGNPRSLSVCEVAGDNPPLLALCRLCLVIVPGASLYRVAQCGCYFCHQCIQQYVTISAREGNVVIPCPDGTCPVGGVFDTSEIEKLVEKEVFQLYQRCKLNRDVELDPHQTWCPGPGCESVCHIVPGIGNGHSSPVHCTKCKLTFCSECKERWHAYQTCDEFRKQLSDDELPSLPGEELGLIKRCPHCRVPIERDEGCAQMMCKRCRHVFCWYCLASLDDDFLLRHYDKGPCKNKLGHSRASVVWHRTQVVGIFAGFGFLLLLASPLLLLAAPCLLCCRCSSCHRCLDTEPTNI